MLSVKITTEALKDLFMGKVTHRLASVTTVGIPMDADLVDSSVDHSTGILSLIFDAHDGEEEILPVEVTVDKNNIKVS